MWLVGDRSRVFTVGLAVSWVVVVALPIALSIIMGVPAYGLPLLGVVLWFVLLRVARVLSPAARADAAMRRGRYEAALALCEQALAVRGDGSWTGTRRLVWLNRRTSALLALGRADEALASSLEALEISADPETLGNCAAALVRLNRYNEATVAARQALALTRERSVIANASLAQVMLARGLAAEAEALARAGLVDVQALLPLVHREHHAACLAALARAEQMQGHPEVVQDVLRSLDQITRRVPPLRAYVLAARADALPGDDASKEAAFKLLADAFDRDEHYVLWYVAQSDTLRQLRGDPRFEPAEVASVKELRRLDSNAADSEAVDLALTKAREHAIPRPAPQASGGALVAQIVTLAGTLTLLLWWCWNFFILGT